MTPRRSKQHIEAGLAAYASAALSDATEFADVPFVAATTILERVNPAVIFRVKKPEEVSPGICTYDAQLTILITTRWDEKNTRAEAEALHNARVDWIYNAFTIAEDVMAAMNAKPVGDPDDRVVTDLHLYGIEKIDDERENDGHVIVDGIHFSISFATFDIRPDLSTD